MNKNSILSNLETTTINGPENKHFKMKQFITATKEYLQTRAEDIAIIITRHLQALSVTIDLSIFDPHTSVVSEFFVSLHELLSNLDQRCSFAWYCVDVLSNACRNPAARNALIHTYQFLPQLSRLLGDQLTLEKKLRLLNLMQELTCGIRITWQIPHLPHLMATLTRWVESDNEEVVTLSLGVLVNLCYKNLSAVYTLTRCIDLKKFVKICMPLQGVKIEVHVCKLLIILDYMNGKVPESAILKLIDVTFKSMIEAFKARDSILLRHIVEFFLDIVQQKSQSEYILSYNQYDTEVEKLLAVVENDLHNSGDGQEQDPECMALLFEFLNTLLEFKLPKLSHMFSRIVHVALKWIQTDIVCSQALSTLRTIAINTDCKSESVLEPLIAGLPIFLFALNTGDEEIPTHIEHNKRLSSLLQLLKVLVQTDQARTRVLLDLKEETIRKVFIPLIGTDLPRTRATDADTYSMEAIELYVHALAFVHELAKHNTDWITVHSNLMQQKQIHMVLAQGLYIGSGEVKDIILTMASNKLFPTYSIAKAMTNLQPLVQTDSPNVNNSSNQSAMDNMCFPIIPVTQIEKLDDVMSRLKEAIDQKHLMNISTSDVMELYEYKLASMGHAERAAMASAEAASQRCIHLQHRTAQLTAELTRLHQLLLHTQQCHENVSKIKDSLTETNRDLFNKLEAEKGRFKACSGQLKLKEKTLMDIETMLDDTSKKLKEISNIKATFEEQNTDLRKVVTKLEENLNRKEKVIEKKEELLARANANNENLKMQVVQLERQLNHTETELHSRTNDLKEVTKELATRKQIIDTITKVANSQMV